MKAVLSVLYGACKWAPVSNRKVLFLSRQSNRPSIDFMLLQEELKSATPDIEVVTICCKYSSKRELPRFFIASLRSMYHLATSKVCVLDAYWPLVSILRHKSELVVIQLWHSLGKVKKSGYQTLGSTYGRGYKLAQYMNMHKGYDYIIAGGCSWNSYYCESFNTTEDVLRNFGLPRIDYLLKTQEANKSRFFKAYPHLKQRKIILYAPTFRRSFNPAPYVGSLVDSIDYSHYALIVKAHPNQRLDIQNPSVTLCESFKAIDLLAACDYLITDYSAIAIEAAVLSIKTYYYLYDFEDYRKNNGINIDLPTLMNNCVFTDAASLVESLTSKEYPYEELERYKAQYLPDELGTSTKQIAALVIDSLSTIG